MRFGFRTPSLTKRISARTSLKRIVRSKIRVTRGMGTIINPKRALYNKVYKRTTVSIPQLGRRNSLEGKASISNWATIKIVGYLLLIGILIAIWPLGLLAISYITYRFFFKSKKTIAIEDLHIQADTTLIPNIERSELSLEKSSLESDKNE
jgi:hypothetical protein